MEQEKSSHKSILKATGVVGGAQVIIILIGLIRTKLIAVLLGPAGIGINGILQNTADLVRQATGFGINFSGVKEIASASGTGDVTKIDRTITIVRRWAIYTGLLGMLITLVLCLPLSYYAFGNERYALSIALISVTLLFTSISSGQLALLQGLRQIGQMAKVSVYGAALSLIVTLPLYAWLGEKGIVLGIIISAIVSLIISFVFTRKIKITRPQLTFRQTITEGINMARLGFLIVVTGLIVTITMYAIRSFIAQNLDLESVGCFVAVWTISNTYVNIILGAMLSDFFPRLSEVEMHNDNKRTNNLINEQLDMALVIATPLIIFLVGGAQLVIRILFTPSFLKAVPVLQWQLFAGFIGIISWTLGVIFLAKNKGKFSLITESIWSLVYYIFVVLGWENFGFLSLGIGCLVAHLVKFVCVYIFTKGLSDFNFDKKSFKSIAIFGVLVASTFINVICFEGIIQYVVSAIFIVISSVYSFFRISEIIDIKGFFKKKLNR